MLKEAGFLGTGASLGSDLTLIIQIIFYIALCAGVVAQRRRMYKLHDWIQTPVVVLNLFFIIGIMVASFREQAVAQTLPDRPTDSYYFTAAIHAGLGLLAEGLAIYSLLAGHQILPRKIGRLRYVMWATFIAWTAAFLFGTGTYYFWYIHGSGVNDVAVGEVDGADTGTPGDPASKNILLQQFVFAPGDLTIVSGTEVTWLNQDSAPHNVTFADGSVATDNFFREESFTFTFADPGDYQVFCTLHGDPTSGMSSLVTVLEATDENIAEAEVAQAQIPTPNPIPPTPTPAPAVPPASAGLIEPPEPEVRVVGIISFFDDIMASDSVNVTLSQLSPPSAGHNYEAWLLDSRSGQIFSLGLIEPNDEGSLTLIYTDPDHRNLLAAYDTFQITEEVQFDDDPNPDTVVYAGRQPAQATAPIRAMLVTADDTPDGIGYSSGARLQAAELVRHIALIEGAFEFLSLGDAQRHAEHILNILEGENGEFFGDKDGAHGAQNPGDGYGLIPYLEQMNNMAIASQEAADATTAITVHSSHVVLATANALEWSLLIRTAVLEILAADRIEDIGPQVETLQRYGGLLILGEDTNGDGNVAPTEGGIFTAYQHGQYMGAIGVLSGDSALAWFGPAGQVVRSE